MWLYDFIKIYEYYIKLKMIIITVIYLDIDGVIVYVYPCLFSNGIQIRMRMLHVRMLVRYSKFYLYLDRFKYENKFKQILSYLLLSLYPKKTNKNLNNACIENVGGLSILPCFLQTYLKEKTPKIKMKILESSNS